MTQESTNLHPDFPVVEGRYRLTREWELELSGKFNRRIEDGNMVLWRSSASKSAHDSVERKTQV